MAIFMRLKVRYIKIADIQVRSTHTHRQIHTHWYAVNCDGMHWCDYTKCCKCGRWQGNEEAWGRHVYEPKANVGSVSVPVQVTFVVVAAARCCCCCSSLLLLFLLLLLSAAIFICLFCSAAVHQLPHKADAFITLLLRNFSCFFFPSPLPLSLCRSVYLIPGLLTEKLAQCAAWHAKQAFSCCFLFSVLPSLFFSVFFFCSALFFAFCLLLLLLPLSVGHAPATLHWPWSPFGPTVVFTPPSLACLFGLLMRMPHSAANQFQFWDTLWERRRLLNRDAY